MGDIKFPFAAADVIAVPDSGTPNVAIVNTKTLLQMPTTQNMTLSLTASKDLLIGSEVVVEIVQGVAARNIAFGSAGTAIKGTSLAGTASKTERVKLTYDGVRFAMDNAWASL